MSRLNSITSLVITTLGIGAATPALSQNSSVLDLFPPSGIAASEGSKDSESSCSFEYRPSGSTWVEGIDEKGVFLASMTGDGWTLGVGKGGHIYSLRSPLYGESVPPQRIVSPWNDEVWQAVATNEDIIGPIHDYQAEIRGDHAAYLATKPLMYFIHQAGIYTEGADDADSKKKTAFYSPLLRKEWDPKTKTLKLVNWMQQAHTPCVWKSGVLIYTAYRDLGDGILEVNQVLHNFGDEDLAYFSAPWGGIRHSRLPHTIISRKGGTWKEEKGQWGWGDLPQLPLNESDGWEAWVKDPKDEKSPALSFVFGHGVKDSGEPCEGKRIILWGNAGNDKVRDYQVTEVSSQLNVKPHSSLSMRWYLVTDTFADARGISAKLAKKARVQRISFDDKATQAVHVDGNKVNTNGAGTEWIKLAAFPAPGTVPVFLLKDKRSGKQIVSTDLYALAESTPYPNPLPKEHKEFPRYENRVVYKQYAPHIVYEDLLGYAYKTNPKNESAKPLTAIDGVELHESTKGLWVTE